MKFPAFRVPAARVTVAGSGWRVEGARGAGTQVDEAGGHGEFRKRGREDGALIVH